MNRQEQMRKMATQALKNFLKNPQGEFQLELYDQVRDELKRRGEYVKSEDKTRTLPPKIY